MTDRVLFSNFGISKLASGITSGALTFNVTPTEGAKFSNPVSGQYFKGMFFDTSGNREIVHCTARATDQITIVRGQEGTSPRAWNANDGFMQLGHSAGMMDLLVQRREFDIVTAVDGGTNLLTLTLDPAPTAYYAGMRIRFIVPSGWYNTAGVNINVNSLGNVLLRDPANLPLTIERLPGDAIIEAVYLAGYFRIVSGLESYLVGESIEWNEGTFVPSGFLPENGSEYSRTTYARLFRVIGTAFGAGDGSTTFNVPDSRGRVILKRGIGTMSGNIGSGNWNASTDEITYSTTNTRKYHTGMKVQLTTTGTLPTGLSLATDYWLIKVSSTILKLASSLANAVAGIAVDFTDSGTGTHTLTHTLESRIFAEYGGEEDHANTIAEMPSHDHTNSGNLRAVGGSSSGLATGNNQQGPVPNTGFTGGSGAHNNMPPFLVKDRFIYAGV